MIRVLIVEDQKMAQENIEAIVHGSDRYTLAGSIANAADAELFCMREQVELILMDVCTARDESGIDATVVIKKRFPWIKIIIVTSMAEHTFLEEVVELAPCGRTGRFGDAHIFTRGKAAFETVTSGIEQAVQHLTLAI